MHQAFSQHLVLTFFCILYRLCAIGFNQLFLRVLFFPVFPVDFHLFHTDGNISKRETNSEVLNSLVHGLSMASLGTTLNPVASF